MADPNQWEFSCINPDGALNIEKYTTLIWKFANYGANCTREFPYLVTDHTYTGTAKQRNYLPFHFADGRYHLNHLNPVYFDNLRQMITIANRHNMAFQFSIFDRTHSLNMPDSPWNLNHQGKQGYYQWDQYTEKYVNRIIATFREAESQLRDEGIVCKVLFELENEPMDPAFVTTAMETLKRLLAAHYQKEQMEDGVSYLPYRGGRPVIQKVNGGNQLIRHPLFEALKRAKRKAGVYPGDDQKDKSRYFSTIHQVDKLIIRELMEALKHTRRFSISCDGEKPKPGAAQWYARVLPLFKAAARRPRLMRVLQTWKFEHIFRGTSDGNSMLGDSIDGVLGISQAHYDAFGTWPENFGKFPHPVDQPSPQPIPITEQIKLLQNRIRNVEDQVEENIVKIRNLERLLRGGAF